MAKRILLDEVRSKSIITPDIKTESEIVKLLRLMMEEGETLLIRCERLYAEEGSTDYDTVGYFYGDYVEIKRNEVGVDVYNLIPGRARIPIYQYYKMDQGVWVAISPDEYRNRVVRHEKRMYEAFWGNVHQQR